MKEIMTIGVWPETVNDYVITSIDTVHCKLHTSWVGTTKARRLLRHLYARCNMGQADYVPCNHGFLFHLPFISRV